MPNYIDKDALIKRLEVTPILMYGIPEEVRAGVIDLVARQPTIKIEDRKSDESIK